MSEENEDFELGMGIAHPDNEPVEGEEAQQLDASEETGKGSEQESNEGFVPNQETEDFFNGTVDGQDGEDSGEESDQDDQGEDQGETHEEDDTGSGEQEIPEGYYSEEQLEEKIQERMDASPAVGGFANERMRKMNDYVAAGGEINERFWAYQDVDFANADLTKPESSIEILTANLIDIQGLSEEEAAFMIEDKYPALRRGASEDDDEDSKRAYDREVLKARIEAKGVLPGLKEFQDKLMLPKAQEAAPQPTQQEIQERDDKIAEYHKQAKDTVDNFDGFDFQLSDDVTLNFKATEENMGYVRELAESPEKQSTFLADRYVENGKVDMERFVTDMYILDNIDTIFKESANQLKTMGKEENINEEGVVPRLGTRRNSGSGDRMPSMAEQILRNANI
jgi:hypothetical protein